MTLYFTLVFMLLMAEMGLFVVLIVPFPFAVKRRIFTVNRVYRVQVELAATTDNNNNGAAILGRERLEVQARKFYSQRNMYLCGFTLFLSLILNRTYTMILEVLRLEEKLKKYEGTAADTQQSEKLTQAGDMGEIGKLRKELAKKDQDIATLKKQAEGLQREYDDLCEKYGATQAPAGPKKTK
ncbi:MAG: Endoplasmic reticulum transmembrane protein 3 [Sporothrix thermara]